MSSSDVNSQLIEPLKEFAKDSIHLVRQCTKPDREGNSQRSQRPLALDF
ncbi:unnamed protein product [Heterosigma akashiwo]